MESFPRFLAVALLALACALGGCKQDLYNNLAEDEANRILAVLLENGVAAEKALKGKNGVTLSVPDEEVVRALKILRNKGLPRERFKNMGDIFSGQGMIASPTEEQARLTFAIAQELAETFANIDGVLTARAHVVLGSHDAASGTRTSASAAIFLRHTPDSPVADLQGKIKETCVQSVPGLAYDNVAVMLAPAREEIVLPVVKDAGRENERLAWIGAAALLAVLLVASLFFARRRKKTGAGQA